MLYVVLIGMIGSMLSGIPMMDGIIGQSLPSLDSILREVEELTEFQFDARAAELSGNRVSGSGEVNDVGTVDWLDAADAPNGYGYKVIVHLNGHNSRKAVVFLRSSDGLATLGIGDSYSFTGEIISIKDWGFWFTAYIKGD